MVCFMNCYIIDLALPLCRDSVDLNHLFYIPDLNGFKLWFMILKNGAVKQKPSVCMCVFSHTKLTQSARSIGRRCQLQRQPRTWTWAQLALAHRLCSVNCAMYRALDRKLWRRTSVVPDIRRLACCHMSSYELAIFDAGVAVYVSTVLQCIIRVIILLFLHQSEWCGLA